VECGKQRRWFRDGEFSDQNSSMDTRVGESLFSDVGGWMEKEEDKSVEEEEGVYHDRDLNDSDGGPVEMADCEHNCDKMVVWNKAESACQYCMNKEIIAGIGRSNVGKEGTLQLLMLEEEQYTTMAISQRED